MGIATMTDKTSWLARSPDSFPTADGMDLRLDLFADKTAGGWREETE